MQWAHTSTVGAARPASLPPTHSDDQVQVTDSSPLLRSRVATAGVTSAPYGNVVLGACAAAALRVASSPLFAFTGAKRAPARGAACLIALFCSTFLMLGGWLLSFLGCVIPLTVCYDSGDRIFFFGGYGDIVPCPAHSEAPPFPFQVRSLIPAMLCTLRRAPHQLPCLLCRCRTQ